MYLVLFVYVQIFIWLQTCTYTHPHKIRTYKTHKNVEHNSYYILLNVGTCSERINADNDERIMNILDRNGVVSTSVGVVNNGIKCLVKPLPKYHCRGSSVEKNIFKVLLIYGILIYYSCKILFKGTLFSCISLNSLMC